MQGRNKESNIVVGLSFGHGDSSAALVCDGELIAAAEEERFTRVKHDAGFPKHALEYCLTEASVKPSEVNCIAIAKNSKNTAIEKLKFAIAHPKVSLGRKRSKTVPKISNWLKEMGIHAAIEYHEHHHAHLSSARALHKGEMALMSFDGLGDFTSVMLASAKNENIQILERIFFPHSLGFFYTAMTQYLGFPYFGDEFKVMGLSSLGEPKYVEELRGVVQTKGGFGFKLNPLALPINNLVNGFYIENNQPYGRPLYNASFLTQILGISPRRKTEKLSQIHFDLASSVQKRFEEVAFQLLSSLFDRTNERTLGLAGGCAHNSVWVGKIAKRSPFERIHVAPASHDAGIAVGAAILSAKKEVTAKSWSLLGPSDSFRPNLGQFSIKVDEITPQNRTALAKWIAERLAQGEIVGLFNGRLEFGPRALGSRSILADPRDPGMKDKLNARVKHREWFRPFAVSILWEEQLRWMDDSFFSPTMEAVFKVKTSKQQKIPSAVHADATCRIQSVTEENQPLFYSIIKEFYKLTGVPMLINTSFNDSEPIVCFPEHAIHCFENCEMDHLVIGETCYSRTQAASLKAS